MAPKEDKRAPAGASGANKAKADRVTASGHDQAPTAKRARLDAEGTSPAANNKPIDQRLQSCNSPLTASGMKKPARGEAIQTAEELYTSLCPKASDEKKALATKIFTEDIIAAISVDKRRTIHHWAVVNDVYVLVSRCRKASEPTYTSIGNTSIGQGQPTSTNTEASHHRCIQLFEEMNKSHQATITSHESTIKQQHDVIKKLTTADKSEPTTLEGITLYADLKKCPAGLKEQANHLAFLGRIGRFMHPGFQSLHNDLVDAGRKRLSMSDELFTDLKRRANISRFYVEPGVLTLRAFKDKTEENVSKE